MTEAIGFQLTRPRSHLESGLQRAVVQYLRWALPDDCEYFAIPNGGYRWTSEAKRMVGEGVKAGVPDLQVIHKGRAVFFELKSENGRVSAIQRQMHDKLVAAGAEVFVARSVHQVQAMLLAMGVRLRGKVG